MADPIPYEYLRLLAPPADGAGSWNVDVPPTTLRAGSELQPVAAWAIDERCAPGARLLDRVAVWVTQLRHGDSDNAATPPSIAFELRVAVQRAVRVVAAGIFSPALWTDTTLLAQVDGVLCDRVELWARVVHASGPVRWLVRALIDRTGGVQATEYGALVTATPLEGAFVGGRSALLAVRPGGALDAAGAYDADPVSIAVSGAATAWLGVDYAPGAAGGGAQVKVELSADGVTWRDETLADAAIGVLVDGSFAVKHATAVHRLPIGPGAWRLAVPVAGARFVRFRFAEYGAVGAPGMLAAEVVFEQGTAS